MNTPSSVTDATVCIVIAAWNADTTLEMAVLSAQAQTVPIEIVIVDDASEDNTRALAERLASHDTRITVLTQDENKGPAAARNRAFAHTTAPWITILDSDDFMVPDRLEHMIALAQAEHADFVADDLLKVNQSDPHGPQSRMYTDDDIGLLWLTTTSFVRANLSSQHGGRRELGFLKPLMSRHFLEKNNLAYLDMKLGEDYVLYANALACGARFLLTDPLGYIAVVRPESLSGTHPTSAHAELMAADTLLLQKADLPSDARAAIKAHHTEQYKKLAWRQLIDAKRARNLTAAISCFRAPLPVAIDLSKRLLGDVILRLTGNHPSA